MELVPPEPLNLTGNNIAENWRRWKQRFELFSLASGLSEKDEKVQAATLLHTAGAEALEVYNTFAWENDEDKNKVEKIKEKFQAYCNPRRNVTWERHVFNTRNQLAGESIDQYVTDLKIKAQTCEFENSKDSLIRDRIVCGIICDKTRGRLLRGPNLDLQSAIDICRSNEATATQLKVLGASAICKESTGPTEIDAIQKKPSEPHAHKQPCERCGIRHFRHQPCPAQGAECYKCGRKNHFAKVCRTPITRKPQSRVFALESSEPDDMFIGMIQNTPKPTDWKVTILLNKQRTVFKMDTGAQCNVISKQKYNQVSKAPLHQSNARLVTFGGHQLKTCGKAAINCQHRGRQYCVEFEVVDQEVPSILGLKTCTEMKLVQRIDSLDVDLLDQYSDVFEGLGCITGVTCHIKVDPTHPPVIHPPRRVPVTLRPKIQEELARMESLDVIEKVAEPTDWVNSMVTIIKPNGKVRMCIDPRDLNKAVKREYYPMRTIDEIITRMPNASVFSVLDASSGFWQVKLDQESTKLCAFNTPFGRYMFKRLPFGLSSSQDIFQKIMSEMFEDIPGVEVVVDDLLIWGENREEHDERLIQVLQRARHRGLKLNKAKCQFRQHEISYIGHVLSKDGIKPDPKKTEAITQMTPPQNKEEVQRFLGMLTYLAKFIPNLSQIAAPLRVLLEKDTQWHWHEEQVKSFKALKQLATEAPVLKYFDPNKHTKLSVDASSKGVGAVLLQEGHPIAYASKALTNSQQNYAQIEKEMFAIVFGCTRFHEYIYGMQTIEVETDHKPLETILKKPLYQAPARLQKMIMTVQKYSIDLVYRPGKELVIADALSRAYLPEQSDMSTHTDFEVNVICTLPISNSKLLQLQTETKTDPVLQQLKMMVEKGWPSNKREVPKQCLPFWSFHDQVSFNDGIFFKGEKVIIPGTMQPEMLKLIHNSHLGIEKCKRRARDVLYWPGMSTQIEDFVSNCSVCSTYTRSNTKEPLLPHSIPSRPWSKVGGDLFELRGKHYLILVDYYSGFVELNHLHTTTSNQVITQCKSQFARHGIPDIIITDNGPQFSSHEFKQFAQNYQFEHRTTSPYHPQSNGMAEKSVQTVKNLMKKALHDKKDPYLALLDYRNTPQSDNVGSPVQRLMGRRTKTLIPTTKVLLKPKVINPSVVQKELRQRKLVQKRYYNQHVKRLPKLKVGESVWLQVPDGRWAPAKVSGVSKRAPRSYFVTTPQGHSYRRNRKHLRKMSNNHTDNRTDNTDYLEEEDAGDSGNTCVVPNGESQMTTPPVIQSEMPLRRSQRTIRKPVRYSDSNY